MSRAYPVRRGKHALLKPLDSCVEAIAGYTSFTLAIGDSYFAYVIGIRSAEQIERMCFVALQAVSASNNAS